MAVETKSNKEKTKTVETQAVTALQEQISELTSEMKSMKGQHQKELEQREAQIRKEVEDKAAKESAQLEADQDIKSLLAMDTNGKASDDEGLGAEKELNADDILDVVATAFDTAINAKMRIMEDKMSKMADSSTAETKKLQTYLLQREAKAQVDIARTKFFDFDDYKEDIGEILKTSGVSVEDAYILAKGRKAKEVPSKSETDSEKPTNLEHRIDLASQRREKRKNTHQEHDSSSGRSNIRHLLREAVDRVQAEKTTII